MTTAARAREADDASVAFQIALTQIGAKSIQDALTLWEDVPVDVQTATASRWLQRAIRLVLFNRKRSRALALAYYRLGRALRTGKTIADPGKPEPTYVSLNMLRQEWQDLIEPTPQARGEVVSDEQPTDGPQVQEQAAEPSTPSLVDDDNEDDDDLILVEEIEGLQAELDRIDAAAEQEAKDLLIQLGPVNSKKKQREIDTSQPGDVVEKAKAEAHKKAGNRQAAIVGHASQNGARSTIYGTGSKDKAVIGWVRLSRTGTPCGWCAMLISRGPVFKDGRFTTKGLYRTAQGAGRGATSETFIEDADKYHPNCNCYAEPVYSVEQVNDSTLFELNRLYARLWPQVTKGLGGDAALSAWRNFIRRQQAAPVQATRAA